MLGCFDPRKLLTFWTKPIISDFFLSSHTISQPRHTSAISSNQNESFAREFALCEVAPYFVRKRLGVTAKMTGQHISLWNLNKVDFK